MSILITEHEPKVLVAIRDLRFIFDAVDVAHSELEAAVADGDVKEEVTDDLREAIRMLRTAIKGQQFRE